MKNPISVKSEYTFLKLTCNNLESMMSNDVISKLSSFITDEILKQPGRELAPDSPLISSGLIDSFSLMDVALFVEDTFSVRIEDTELNAETFDTLQELADLIKSRQ